MSDQAASPSYKTFKSPYNDHESTTTHDSRRKVNQTPLFAFLTCVFVICAASIVYYSGGFGGSTELMSSSKAQQATKKGSSASSYPNIVMIIADDLGYGSFGYEAFDLAGFTPHLTSMYKNGIALTNFYSQEECTPARAALLTGRYPATLGMQFHVVQPTHDWGLATSETLLPEVLQTYGDYKSYGVGKWHLGHYESDYLPTARGFDQFFGYTAGSIYYWSKKSTQLYTNYTDLLYMDTDCFYPYSGDDLETYSTILFRDKALNVINTHDFDENPLFLYLPFQAVHEPFYDFDLQYKQGIPSSYFKQEVYDKISNATGGVDDERFQYALALNLLDSAVGSVASAIQAVGQMQNTYFVFLSDNGGCTEAGGRNGNLRGIKGSLFEGGTKVDAFIYSEAIDPVYRNQNFSDLMHVSDLFPTILDLVGIDYTSTSKLDGISHATSMLSNSSTAARTEMLYNAYYNADNEFFVITENATIAVRGSRYKLMHAFVDNSYSGWTSPYAELEDDDGVLTPRGCNQEGALTGTFVKMLFDLQEDPYETNNLYDNDDYSLIKV